MSKKFHRIEKPVGQMQKFDEAPWEVYQEPFRIAPHVYYVSGNNDWAVYLIDTGDGLILIDTSMSNVLYLLIDSIYKMGFDLRNIKKILLSHGHPDHDGGARQLRELTGAEIYLSKEDLAYKEVIKSWMPKVFPYEVDHFYDDLTPITLGNITIRTKLCPGHTPGVTSYLFVDKDENGREYKVGMHGGVGLPPVGIKDPNRKIPADLLLRFIVDCEDMKDWEIDICLPSHENQINLLANVPEDKMDFSPFVDKEVWRDLMLERAEAARRLLANA